MVIIGLTGGIASGKSSVSAVLKECGALVIDADEVARQAVQPQQPAWYKIIGNFGRTVLLEDDQIDRKQLGNIIFHDPVKKLLLEQSTHPYILQLVQERIAQGKNEGYDIIVLDVPLLFEVGWDKMADQIWVVYVSKATQLARLMQRDRLSDLEALVRIGSQMSLEEKKARADLVIDNGDTPECTREQVIQACNRVRNQAGEQQK